MIAAAEAEGHLNPWSIIVESSSGNMGVALAIGIAPPKTLRYVPRAGPVAQLDRALPSEGRGREFESRRVRQLRTKPRTPGAAVPAPAAAAAANAVLSLYTLILAIADLDLRDD